MTRWRPSGSPELQVQGRRQTGQVEQRVEHFHGGGGVKQGREECHELGGQGRAVPGQELQGEAGGSAGPGGFGGATGWAPATTEGGSRPRPRRCCHGRAAVGRGVCSGPPTFSFVTVTQGSKNTPSTYFIPLFFLLLHPLLCRQLKHFHFAAAFRSD